MMSPVIKNWIYLTFINEPPTIEATALSHIQFLGSSILAPVTYPFAFINKTGGPFHFPPCLFASSSSSRPRRAQASPPPSTLEPAPTRPLHQPVRTRDLATLLRRYVALVSTPFLNYQICIRVPKFFSVHQHSSVLICFPLPSH